MHVGLEWLQILAGAHGNATGATSRVYQITGKTIDFFSILLRQIKDKYKHKSSMEKQWQLDNYWLNPDNFNVK